MARSAYYTVLCLALAGCAGTAEKVATKIFRGRPDTARVRPHVGPPAAREPAHHVERRPADLARLGARARRRRRRLRDPARERQRRRPLQAHRHHDLALRHRVHRRRRQTRRPGRRPDRTRIACIPTTARAVSRAVTRRSAPPPSPSRRSPSHCRSTRTCRAARCSRGSRASSGPSRATASTAARPWPGRGST